MRLILNPTDEEALALFPKEGPVQILNKKQQREREESRLVPLPSADELSAPDPDQ